MVVTPWLAFVSAILFPPKAVIQALAFNAERYIQEMRVSFHFMDMFFLV